MRSCSYSTECKKEVHYTLVHNTTITVVHKIHSGAQHIHDTETFRLPECQVAVSAMISVLTGTLGARGGGKGCDRTNLEYFTAVEV